MTITKAARVSTSDPAKVFSELAKVYFAWAKDFANDFHMRPPRKGSRKIRERNLFIREDGRLQLEEFRSTAIYNIL